MTRNERKHNALAMLAALPLLTKCESAMMGVFITARTIDGKEVMINPDKIAAIEADASNPERCLVTMPMTVTIRGAEGSFPQYSAYGYHVLESRESLDKRINAARIKAQKVWDNVWKIRD